VRILGRDLSTDLEQVKRRINLMRGFSGAPMGLDARQFLEYYLHLYDCFEPGKADELLGVVGLSGATGLVSEFSSGMRQRIFFAKALVNDPDVLFLDEPTVGLDIYSQLMLRRAIAELRTRGKTILLTTHYLLEAEALCDEIALINHGGIIAKGTPAQLKRLVAGKEILRVTAAKPADVASALRRIGGVWQPSVRGGCVEAELRAPKAFTAVLSALARAPHSWGVSGVEIIEPPFEETFLSLVNER
jgi:ABC-2 type transport system ATP-binding protein